MLKLLKIQSFFTLFIWICSVQCDHHTSVSSLENLFGLESMWVQNFENYVANLKESNKFIRKYLENVEKVLKEFPFYDDPLASLTALKRVSSDWKEWEGFALKTKESDEYRKSLEQIQIENSIALPVDEDLKGAARTMARLQDTYNLKTEDIANGKLLVTQSSAKMTASDCFQLARCLYDVQDYHHSIEWLFETRSRKQKSSNTTAFEDLQLPDDENILEFLGPAFFNIGNFKMAVKINDELLSINPGNAYGLASLALFRNQLNEDHDLDISSISRPTLPNNQTELEHRIEAVCRGELKQTAAEKRDLRCHYVSNNVPFCLLAPFKLEELSLDPIVVYYHESIYENEISKIIQHSAMNFTYSEISRYGWRRSTEMRLKKDTGLWYEWPTFLAALAQRLNDMTGLSLKSAETLRVANYGVGSYSAPHNDCEDSVANETENRVATALFYINNVELGGAEAFPLLDLAVSPVRRGLLFWYNMDTTLGIDNRAIHAGCPILKGSKSTCKACLY